MLNEYITVMVDDLEYETLAECHIHAEDGRLRQPAVLRCEGLAVLDTLYAMRAQRYVRWMDG